MKVFRLANRKFANDFSGKGAELNGGRWNNVGTPIIYTSESRALCFAELLAHLQTPNWIPDEFILITIELPANFSILEIGLASLPAGWKNSPDDHIPRKIGDDFIRTGTQEVLKVPSVIVPNEFNFLINPKFSSKLTAWAEPFPIDERFLNR